MSWAERKDRIASNISIDDLIEELEVGLYDEEKPRSDGIIRPMKLFAEQHKMYKWYGYEDNINILNLYFPKNYYINSKLYSIGDGRIYLRYMSLRDTFRSAIATFIPYPYSIEYNDSTIIVGIQYESFHFNKYLYGSDYDNGNEVLECRVKSEGFILMGTFMFVDVVKQQYWLLLELEGNIILIVCRDYSTGNYLESLYIYVVDISDTNYYNALV